MEKKWGVPPPFIGDILALTGDSSDNIPGVPGIGEKTAAQLVRTHGTTEAMLANLSAISPARLQEKIATHRDQIVSNRQMVALDLDLPLPVDWRQLEIHPQYPELIAALRECEFKGLLNEVEDEAAKAQPAQADLFA